MASRVYLYTIDIARIRLNYLGRVLSEMHGQRRCKISDDGAIARTAEASGAVTSQGYGVMRIVELSGLSTRPCEAF